MFLLLILLNDKDNTSILLQGATVAAASAASPVITSDSASPRFPCLPDESPSDRTQAEGMLN